MRRTTIAKLGCALAITLIAGCGGDSNNAANANGTGNGNGTSNANGGSGGTGGGTTAPQPLSDPEVALVLLDANANEVGDGGLGVARAQNDQVVAFAQKMIDDHSMALTHARTTLAATQIAPQQSLAGQQRSVQSVGAAQQL